MKTLLTGGAGFIASHTAVALQEAGHDVVLYDNLANSSVDVVSRVETITGRRVPFVNGDVRNYDLLKATCSQHEVEAVIHFAGLKAVGESVAKPVDYFDNNVGGTIRLLEVMRDLHIKQLVFSSSATVYGDPQYLPLDEAHPTSATNPYGRSKLHVEQILADVARAHSDWKITSLRYFNPVGAHSSGLIGEDPNGIPNNLMPYVAQVATGKLSHLNVFGNDYSTPDGTGVRDYIHVMDLAEGHVAALNALQTRDNAYDVINLGTGRGFSVLEMVAAFEQASGQRVPYQFAPRRSGDIAACYANVDKASSVLGWQSRRTLADMCASTWAFQVNKAR
jgi:UDP-glucose 4-epimerase